MLHLRSFESTKLRLGSAFGHVVMLLACGLLGCASNPLKDVNWQNPFEVVDTSYKAAYGLTPAEVATEIRSLGGKVAEMSKEEQQKAAAELSQRFRSESDPLLRRDIVYSLGSFPDPYATSALHDAMADEDRFVRAEACRAWGRRSSEEAMRVLAGTIQSDESVDVRQIAIQSIKRFKHPEAMQALGGVLNERDPSMQYLAMQSLKSATGQQLGNQVQKWNEYIASNFPVNSTDAIGSPDAGTMIASPTDSDVWR